MKIARRSFKLILAIYLIGCVFLYFFQDQLIFDPHKLPEDHQFREGNEVEIAVTEDISLNCLYVRERDAKGVILYLHGNRGNNRRCLRQAEMMMGGGYDIFMPDYRGFGKSEGRIVSQKQLFRDVQKVYDFLKTIYNEEQIVLVGYSLGTGLASHLAAQNQPRHLFLVAPYLSFVDLKNRMLPIVPDFLVKYPLSNRKWLKKVNCPVTLFHGTDDEIIPFESSVKLKNINPGLIKLVTLEDAGHRRSIFHNLFRQGVMEKLN